ncbi:IclR family transcriptional regulator (plasmid) [Halocatena salina]|uniref:IclR family transcriptional regulator n=2 Tax=Halocatena salina TaxID=2934340 RepID=A0A8U0A7R7_9EURY|nr:IclR family transcriptional regulator [Halocatena salina]UPM45230.1 IclR family transcriptional regulator [Halocatena salina]
MTTKNGTKVKTATTTLRVVEVLHEQNGSTVTEISKELGLSKSTVYKHLKTLEAERYVVKEDDDTYYVGLPFLSLGVQARRRRRLYETAKPQIQELAQASNEMANLLVEEHGRGIFLYRSDSNQAVNLDTHAGRDVYLHTTAMGKAILAYLPEERVIEIIDQHGLARMTEHTITEESELFEELRSIRDRGWAYDKEERLYGLCCISAPITDSDGEVLGAISVSGPRSRLNGERFEKELPQLVLDAQNIIELNVSYE